jgi:dihydrolipoamide dehydrogenase
MVIYVLGAGIAGLEASIVSSNEDFNVFLFDKLNVGGNYLNLTCIPSKLLIDLSSKTKDFSLIKKELNARIKSARAYYEKILSKLNVKFGKKEVNVYKEYLKIENEKIFLNKEDKVIVCLGSKPITPNILGDENILYSFSILNLEDLPNSVAIIGAGPEGIEIAEIFSNLGVKVILIEQKDRILSIEDEDISFYYYNYLINNKKVEIYTSQKVIKVGKYNNEYFVKTDKNLNIKCEAVFSCVGWKPNLENIHLFDNGNLQYDEFLSYNKKFFYAGDVIGAGVANLAKFHGKIAALNAIGKYNKFEKRVIPYTIYTQPQISSVGIKEKEVKDKSEYKIIKINLNGSIRNVLFGDYGYLKIILDKDNVIRGASCISNKANEIINIISYLIEKKVKIDEISSHIFSHPSIYDILTEIKL